MFIIYVSNLINNTPNFTYIVTCYKYVVVVIQIVMVLQGFETAIVTSPTVNTHVTLVQ